MDKIEIDYDKIDNLISDFDKLKSQADEYQQKNVELSKGNGIPIREIQVACNRASRAMELFSELIGQTINNLSSIRDAFQETEKDISKSLSGE